MLYEIHMIKNYATTNLNRDDLGSPKSCTFGGANRARISSQCLKRSWRTSNVFKEIIGEENLGVRTRKLPELVKNKLIEKGVDSEIAESLLSALSGIGNKKGTPNKKDITKTTQIVFYSNEDIEKVADVVKQLLDSGKKANEITALDIANVSDAEVRPITMDIAMFGRMVTSDLFRDVEGAVQVAHAISTHRVLMEQDYFIAMDDLISGETQGDSGAGFVGDNNEYNSSCYYIYASLDTDLLKENLTGVDNAELLSKKAVEGILMAMAYSDPPAKQNSMASHVLPACTIVECKDRKVPVSYTNAFVKPVFAGANGDLITNSIIELAKEQELTIKDYGVERKASLVFCATRYFDQNKIKFAKDVTICENYADLVKRAMNELN